MRVGTLGCSWGCFRRSGAPNALAWGKSNEFASRLVARGLAPQSTRGQMKVSRGTLPTKNGCGRFVLYVAQVIKFGRLIKMGPLRFGPTQTSNAANENPQPWVFFSPSFSRLTPLCAKVDPLFGSQNGEATRLWFSRALVPLGQVIHPLSGSIQVWSLVSLSFGDGGRGVEGGGWGRRGSSSSGHLSRSILEFASARRQADHLRGPAAGGLLRLRRGLFVASAKRSRRGEVGSAFWRNQGTFCEAFFCGFLQMGS